MEIASNGSQARLSQQAHIVACREIGMPGKNCGSANAD